MLSPTTVLLRKTGPEGQAALRRRAARRASSWWKAASARVTTDLRRPLLPSDKQLAQLMLLRSGFLSELGSAETPPRPQTTLQ